MHKIITESLLVNPPLAFVAGHDHSVQVFDMIRCNMASKKKCTNMPYYNIVSGAGSPSKLTSVSHSENSLFAQLQAGIVVLDATDNNEIFIRVFTKPDKPGDSDEVFRMKMVPDN